MSKFQLDSVHNLLSLRLNISNMSALQCSVVLLVISKSSQYYTMQTILHGRKIEEEEKKQGILEIISDKYCRAILTSTMEKPKSATELTIETGIPISTVYRRLQTLHDNKLLRISGSISEDGKKYFLYKSKVKAISTNLIGSFVEIEILPNIKTAESWERSC